MITVYYQGEKGSFSEIAASRFFKGNGKCIGLFNFAQVFKAVKTKKNSYGIVPLENTLMGSIHQNYDLLLRSGLWIVGETKIQISFNLYALRTSSLHKITEIWSHPVALEQCKVFLSRHQNLQITPVYDAAGVAKNIIDQNRYDVGLIAGPEVGRVYGLQLIKGKIEDSSHNYTRFLAVSNTRKVSRKQSAKTSIVFGVKNAPGILFRCLSIFALRNIDLVKLESRPFVGKPWEYLFYVDFIGSAEEEKCMKAIDDLKDIAVYTKILGSYETKEG